MTVPPCGGRCRVRNPHFLIERKIGIMSSVVLPLPLNPTLTTGRVFDVDEDGDGGDNNNWKSSGRPFFLLKTPGAQRH